MRRLLPLLLVALLAPSASATAKPAKKARCATGAVPVTKVVRGRAAYVRDKRGRVRCKRQAVRRLAAPAATPQGNLVAATDRLWDAAATSPVALRPLQRAVGRRRATVLLDAFLVGWQAKARPRAVPSSFAGKYEGVDGSAEIEVTQATGDQSGFTARGVVEGKVDRAALGALDKSAGEQLPPGVKSASGRVEVNFTDTIARCPTGGKQAGKVKATGKVTLTVAIEGDSPVTVELGAEVEASYVAKVDDAGTWTGIDDLKTTTVLTAGGSGQSTQTYRSVRAGSGFGTDSIIDAKGTGAVTRAIEQDFGQLDSARSVTAGPKGTWKAGAFPISDLRTEANVIAMAKANIAASIAAVAVLEYLRKVTRERTEKAPCGGKYLVIMRVSGIGEFATHTATGAYDVAGLAEPLGGDPKQATAWELFTPAVWTGMVFTSKSECPYVDPISSGTIRFDLARVGEDRIRVKLNLPDASGGSTASVDCPSEDDYDPPPIPGQPGPNLVGAGPLEFELPLSGGTQPFGGGFTDNGSGWTNTGTITVTRQP